MPRSDTCAVFDAEQPNSGFCWVKAARLLSGRKQMNDGGAFNAMARAGLFVLLNVQCVIK